MSVDNLVEGFGSGFDRVAEPFRLRGLLTDTFERAWWDDLCMSRFNSKCGCKRCSFAETSDAARD